MSSWIPYRVLLRLLSPMHIGWRRTGNLQQTRGYVPGRAIWGALTATLTRMGRGNDYEAVGNAVEQDLRYTYFYPTTRRDEVTLWPWDPGFAWRYMGSYASTALSGTVAEEGSLHETECLSPVTREGKDVFLLGYILEKEGCRLSWKEALAEVLFGAARGYGWGRVTPSEIEPSEIEESERCFGYAIEEAHGTPAIRVPERKSVLAHCIADARFILKGEVEPLIGRETTRQAGFGGRVSSATVCWTPGSTVKGETVFTICGKGVLEKVMSIQ